MDKSDVPRPELHIAADWYYLPWTSAAKSPGLALAVLRPPTTPNRRVRPHRQVDDQYFSGHADERGG